MLWGRTSRHMSAPHPCPNLSPTTNAGIGLCVKELKNKYSKPERDEPILNTGENGPPQQQDTTTNSEVHNNLSKDKD